MSKWVLLACFALLIVSCKDVEKKDEKKQAIIGFSQLGSESSWRTCNSESIIKAAEEAGFQIIFDDAQQKQENQIKAIRSFIVYRVDIIIFSPIVETGWDTVLEEAREAQIPVIVVDRKLRIKDKSLIKGYIGQDSKEEGREILAQIIAYNGGELKIGAKAIDIIFSHNDAMTLGILDSLDNYGIKAGKDVAIVSVDGEQKTINELMKGRLNCIVECNPKTGKELLKLVAKVLAGEEIEKETYIDEDIFTENDNFTLFESRGY